jgi:hypothetical protein
MPTPRDYFSKGWPSEGAVIESVKMHSTTGNSEMFQFVELVLEGTNIVARQAAATAAKVYVAVDNYDATDVQASKLLPVWTNTAGKIIVTPHVDTTALAVGDEVEIDSAGAVIKQSANPAIAQVLEITADDEVRLLLY